MDDDIEELFYRINDTEQAILNDLSKFIQKTENYMEKTGAHLWGVYPVNNPYFKPKLEISTDLQFIIGVFHGYINRHDINLYPSVRCIVKEDYEQSILFYKKDKSIIRFNNIRFKTKFNADGGLIKSWDRKCGTPEVKFLKQK